MGLCPLPLAVGMFRCLRVLADAPEDDVGCSWSRCHPVSNPVLALSEPELHPVLHAGEGQISGDNTFGGLREGTEQLQDRKRFMPRDEPTSE